MIEKQHSDFLKSCQVYGALAVVQNFRAEPALIGRFTGKCQLCGSFRLIDGIRTGASSLVIVIS